MSWATRSSLDRFFKPQQMVDLNYPLTDEEQTTLCVNKFIHYAIYCEGKFGQAKREWYKPDDSVLRATFLEKMLDDYIQKAELKLKLDISQLGFYLDEISYEYILKEYLRRFDAKNDRKRNLIAIISIIAFSRLYAQQLRALPERPFACRDLLSLKNYTSRTVVELIHSRMQMTWDEFLDEIRGFEFVKTSSSPVSWPVAISIIGCMIGLCYILNRMF